MDQPTSRQEQEVIMMPSYGIGYDPKTGRYYVVINGRRACTVATCEAALAFIDYDRELRYAGLV